MREELEKLVAAGKIRREHLDPLLELIQGGYCMHRSWGFGKITTVDTVFSRMTIDFQDKPGHSMDLGFACKSLKPIPKEHILARKYSDLDGVRQLAALNHLDLIKVVLESHGGAATVVQIQGDLVPDVIEDDWKKWWEVARKEMKKDGHFTIPLKKAEPIVYHDEVVSLKDRLLDDFTNAKGLKARVTVTSEIVKSLDDIEDAKGLAEDVIARLSAEIQSHLNTKPGIALEAIFARDDLLTASGTTLPEGAPTDKDVWARESATLENVLNNILASKQRRALISYKDGHPEDWIDGIVGILNEVSAKLVGDCADLLGTEGHIELMKSTVSRLINQHQASSELLLWLSKERSDTYADIIGPEVFRAILTAIERDQFNDKRSNKLADFAMDDKQLLNDLLESADIEVIRDIVRALKLSGSFDDIDTRSLLARIVKQFPAIQSMISGDMSPREDKGLVVSWESLERRRAEYEKLVRKKIPANSKEIAIARSYGDLRENHEYKSAKEMQKLLMKRKHELEQDLTRARGTDFSDSRTDVVSIGTKVRLTDVEKDRQETYEILGAWDSDPEQGIISYQTPLAQTLLNHAPGEQVELELAGSQRSYRIEAIEKVEVAVKPPSVDEEAEAEGAVEGGDPAEAGLEPAMVGVESSETEGSGDSGSDTGAGEESRPSEAS